MFLFREGYDSKKIRGPKIGRNEWEQFLGADGTGDWYVECKSHSREQQRDSINRDVDDIGAKGLSGPITTGIHRLDHGNHPTTKKNWIAKPLSSKKHTPVHCTSLVSGRKNLVCWNRHGARLLTGEKLSGERLRQGHVL